MTEESLYDRIVSENSTNVETSTKKKSLGRRIGEYFLVGSMVGGLAFSGLGCATQYEQVNQPVSKTGTYRTEKDNAKSIASYIVDALILGGVAYGIYGLINSYNSKDVEPEHEPSPYGDIF